MKKELKRNLAKGHTLRWYLSARDHFRSKLLVRSLDLFALPLGALANIFKISRFKKENFKYKLGVAVIIKNEGMYLKEWIEYYRIIGVDKFYIFDNDSTDNTYKILEKYIKIGLVDYEQIHGKSRQMDAYNKALRKSKKACKYLLVVDADEFLFSVDSNNVVETIDEIFKKNPQIGGIGINWMIFGSSNYQKRPNGLVTQKFVYRSQYDFNKNKLIKTLCNPRAVDGFLNPHYPYYDRKYYAVDMLLRPINGPYAENDSSMTLRINHYFTKSREEFIKKRNRGMADQLGIRNDSDFKIHDKNDVYDDSMKKYKYKLTKI